MKPWIYIASPYTKGDPCVNTNFQCEVFDRLMADNKVWPYVPLWAHFQHTVYPLPYTAWIAYDNAIIPRLDGCLRLTATNARLNYSVHESSGADNEVELFRSLGKPVYTNIQEMYAAIETPPGYVEPSEKTLTLLEVGIENIKQGRIVTRNERFAQYADDDDPVFYREHDLMGLGWIESAKGWHFWIYRGDDMIESEAYDTPDEAAAARKEHIAKEFGT